MNVDDAGKPLTCKDYARPDPATGEMYSLHAFLAMYDPEGPHGKASRSLRRPGRMRALASAAAQAARVRIRIPPNTTMYRRWAPTRR